MALRILASFLLLLSILFMPFWVSVILALVGMMYFNIFLEAVVLFFIADLLYGVEKTRFFGVFFLSFILSVILLVLVEILKKKLKFYP